MRGLKGISLLAVTVISISYLLGSMPEASAQSINLESGAGLGIVTSLGASWPNVVSQTDCDDAISKTNTSFEVVPLNGLWKPELDSTTAGENTAKWISDDADAGNPPGSNSFLVGHEFTVLPGNTVTLEFEYLIDNLLGDSDNPNVGLFINCKPVPGSQDIRGGFPPFQTDNFLTFDITSLLEPTPTQTLHILAVNKVANTPGGIIYAATIDSSVSSQAKLESGAGLGIVTSSGASWPNVVSQGDCDDALVKFTTSSEVVPLNGLWKPELDSTTAGENTAKWISDNALAGNPPGSNSFLVGHEFTVGPGNTFTLEFEYLIDNLLGDSDNPNVGLFINCKPVPGSQDIRGGFPPFQTDNFLTFDITSLLEPTPTQTLHILAVNKVANTPGGIIYAATIDSSVSFQAKLESGAGFGIKTSLGASWPNVVSQSDCDAAISKAVTSAEVVPLNGLWKPELDSTTAGENTAKWISDNALAGNPPGSNSFLVGHEFTVPAGRATLEFEYLIDNLLGDSDNPNVGLFINCKPVPGSQDIRGGFPPFQTDNFLTFDITSLLEPTPTQTLHILAVNKVANTPGGIIYAATIASSVDTGGHNSHENPTIGINSDGRQLVACGMAIDGQCYTVSKQYHQEFELLQMLTSSHTISNTIYCSQGVQTCNYVAVGFMDIYGDFNNPVMKVSASKDHLGTWTIDWYDPNDNISDPGDAVPGVITFVPQIIDNELLGTSFTIDFKNKDTGQLKMGIQVRDIKNGVSNTYFNEGVEFIDAHAYPSVETSFEDSLKVESLCLNEDPDYRYSCAFAKKRDLATQNAEETLRQMLTNEYTYK